MTRLILTPAKSPTPPDRGVRKRHEGTQLHKNPRPDPEPGPTFTSLAHEPPGQARTAFTSPRRVRVSAVWTTALLLLAAPVAAQVVPTGTPAADILLSQALADQRVFLTCTALDPANHQIALDFWQQDVAAAVALLTTYNVAPEAIAGFTAAAKPESLLPAPDTPFAEVTDFCAAQDHWFQHWRRRDFTELATRLPEAFQ